MELVWNISLGTWETLAQMAPYLLFGFLVAGVLSVLVSPETVEKHLGGHGPWPVLKAALFGVPLPLCSCGVIPVAASLKRHGASKGATTAFLISTPQTGVDSVLVTYGLLGPIFAIFRPIAAFLSGILGGWIIDALDRRDDGVNAPEVCHDECCAPGARHRPRMIRALHYGFVTLPRDIAKPLLAGLIVAGVIAAIVPQGFFADTISSSFIQMLVMVVIGIPIYVCATASVPIAAAMITAGISPGAALVFLMTGPATNAASIAMIWKMMGKRTTIVYLAIVAGGALVCGLVLDAIVVSLSVSHVMGGHMMLPPWAETASAAALLAMLAFSFLRPSHHDHHEAGDSEHKHVHTDSNVEVTIKGMTCSHCAETVRRALADSKGVETVSVDLGTGKARISGNNLDWEILAQIVDSVGYNMVKQQRNSP